MANEVEIINNPDLTPGPVSSGYQRQNTCMVSARIGMDASIIEGGSGQVTALISGPITRPRSGNYHIYEYVGEVA